MNKCQCHDCIQFGLSKHPESKPLRFKIKPYVQFKYKTKGSNMKFIYTVLFAVILGWIVGGVMTQVLVTPKLIQQTIK